MGGLGLTRELRVEAQRVAPAFLSGLPGQLVEMTCQFAKRDWIQVEIGHLEAALCFHSLSLHAGQRLEDRQASVRHASASVARAYSRPCGKRRQRS
jgi:hypothetical protein